MAVRAPHQCQALVVDDDPEVRELIRVALAAEGYRVRVATGGREALDALRSMAETCVIILDLALAGMDGAGFRAAQLRDRSFAWIPVVVVSGAVDARRQAEELHARSFVSKPIDLDELRRALGAIGCARANPIEGRRATP